MLVEVMLGKTVIGPSSAWEGELESALPYIERSVAISDDYESALVDEDIIVGLKVSCLLFVCLSVLTGTLFNRWIFMGGISRRSFCIV